ncbi:MAG TPA: response regulator [Ktedonobacterales bacterium]
MAEVDAIEVATPASPPPTILVIEDEASIARLIQELLRLQGYNPLVAKTGEEGVALAASETPHLILLDLMLPGMDGFEVLEYLRGRSRTAHIPVVVVSAKNDPESIVRAFEVNVDDYVRKPFNNDELMARVGAQLRHAQDQQLSPLTKLPGGLRVERAIDDCLTSGKRWSILYLDLDSFKAYNDVYGFLSGNELIRLLAHITSETVHELGEQGDFVGHIGGDDFIAITTPERAEPLCERIIARWDSESRALYAPEDLAHETLVALDRRGQRQTYPLVSLSIGVVTNERRSITSSAEVSRVAAEVKHVAKSIHGSAWYTDQRG